MNTHTRLLEPKKQVINYSRTTILLLSVLLLFSRCIQKSGSSATEKNGHEKGYLMTDGSGYYFIQLDTDNSSSFKEALNGKKEVNGFKFDFDRDSLEKINLHYDTIVDLNKQQKGFPSHYIYKRVTPIEIVYSPTSIVEPYLKSKISLPIKFENVQFTLVYNQAGFKVSKIIPARN